MSVEIGWNAPSTPSLDHSVGDVAGTPSPSVPGTFTTSLPCTLLNRARHASARWPWWWGHHGGGRSVATRRATSVALYPRPRLCVCGANAHNSSSSSSLPSFVRLRRELGKLWENCCRRQISPLVTVRHVLKMPRVSCIEIFFFLRYTRRYVRVRNKGRNISTPPPFFFFFN